MHGLSPSSSGGPSPGGTDDGGANNLGFGGDGRGNKGGGGPPEDDDPQATNYAEEYGCGNTDSEFQLVNAKSITINQFRGRNLHTIPYLQFNNATTRLILVQGKVGEELLDILDGMEQCGDQRFTKEDLNEIVTKRPKIYKYDRAINFVLLNYTTGIAHGRVKYGVERGPDAWRKLCNRYVLLAEELQNIPIR